MHKEIRNVTSIMNLATSIGHLKIAMFMNIYLVSDKQDKQSAVTELCAICFQIRLILKCLYSFDRMEFFFVFQFKTFPDTHNIFIVS